MINKQDFDKINRGIASRNARKRRLKSKIIGFCIFLALILLCVGAISNNILSACLFGGLIIIPLLFVIRVIKCEPSYTLEQYAHHRAAQKLYIKQAEVQYTMQNGYPGTQVRDGRYIPDHLRLAILTRDNYRCRYCGSNAYLELDHIIPLSKGGATSYENLQVLCRGCNSRKGGL